MKLIDDGFERFEEDFEANPNAMFIIPVTPDYKPIKIAFLDDLEITNSENEYDLEIKKKLSKFEVEKFLNDIFGTTNLGILSCEDIEEKLNE